jgi:hypothetical protein
MPHASMDIQQQLHAQGVIHLLDFSAVDKEAGMLSLPAVAGIVLDDLRVIYEVVLVVILVIPGYASRCGGRPLGLQNSIAKCILLELLPTTVVRASQAPTHTIPCMPHTLYAS